MKPRFNVYKIVEKKKYDHRDLPVEHHKLIFLKTCHDFESAEHWLKGNYEKFVRYTIIPEYYITGFED